MTKVNELETGIWMQNLNNEVMKLYLIAKINPAIWDVIYPRGPKYSQGTINVVAAQIIKAIVPFVKKSALKAKLNKTGNELFGIGKSKMAYDDEQWCPIPFPIPPFPHFPFQPFQPFPLWWWFSLNPSIVSELNPQPQPPSEKYIGGILLLTSEIISNEKLKNSLQEQAKQIAGI